MKLPTKAFPTAKSSWTPITPSRNNPPARPGRLSGIKITLNSIITFGKLSTRKLDEQFAEHRRRRPAREKRITVPARRQDDAETLQCATKRWPRQVGQTGEQKGVQTITWRRRSSAPPPVKALLGRDHHQLRRRGHHLELPACVAQFHPKRLGHAPQVGGCPSCSTTPRGPDPMLGVQSDLR